LDDARALVKAGKRTEAAKLLEIGGYEEFLQEALAQPADPQAITRADLEASDQRTRDALKAAEDARAQAANDDAVCRSYGAAPGSQVYVQCRMNQSNQRKELQLWDC
jgi:hypothetical protein